MDYLSKVKAMIVFAIVEWKARQPGVGKEKAWSVEHTIDWIVSNLHLSDADLMIVLREETKMILYSDSVIDIPGYFFDTEFHRALLDEGERMLKEEKKLPLRASVEFVWWLRRAVKENVAEVQIR